MDSVLYMLCSLYITVWTMWAVKTARLLEDGMDRVEQLLEEIRKQGYYEGIEINKLVKELRKDGQNGKIDF